MATQNTRYISPESILQQGLADSSTFKDAVVGRVEQELVLDHLNRHSEDKSPEGGKVIVSAEKFLKDLSIYIKDANLQGIPAYTLSVKGRVETTLKEGKEVKVNTHAADDALEFIRKISNASTRPGDAPSTVRVEANGGEITGSAPQIRALLNRVLSEENRIPEEALPGKTVMGR